MFTERFATPDGKGHFATAEETPPAETPDEQYPFTLTTGRVLFHYHTASMTGRTDTLAGELEEGFVEMNQEDAQSLGVENGERVTVRSARGSIDVPARVGTDVPPGLVFVPFHFARTQANVLTNPAYDPACKMPEFKVCAVDIRRAAAAGG